MPYNSLLGSLVFSASPDGWFVCPAAGCQWICSARRWPARLFARQIARHIDFGVGVVINGGSVLGEAEIAGTGGASPSVSNGLPGS